MTEEAADTVQLVHRTGRKPCQAREERLRTTTCTREISGAQEEARRRMSRAGARRPRARRRRRDLGVKEDTRVQTAFPPSREACCPHSLSRRCRWARTTTLC